MKKDKKIALIIMFIVGLILMVAIEYSNKATADKIQYEREKIEARLEAIKAKDSIAEANIIVQVKNNRQLRRLMRKITKLKNIDYVERVGR